MTILLMIHIALASVSLVIAAVAAILTKTQKSPQTALRSMWGSYAGIVLTGVGLFIVNPDSLGHLCLLTAVYAAIFSGVHLYAKNATATAEA